MNLVRESEKKRKAQSEISIGLADSEIEDLERCRKFMTHDETNGGKNAWDALKKTKFDKKN